VGRRATANNVANLRRLPVGTYIFKLLDSRNIVHIIDKDEKHVLATALERIRESITRLTPVFSANRAVRQYAEEHCLPLARGRPDRSRLCLGSASPRDGRSR